MTKKVCISGYYGFDNFGDETILKILVENIKKFNNPPSITVFSSNPNKTENNLNVNCVYSFNLKHIIKSIITSDCLISGGGSLLQDVTSSKSLIYYLAILTIAQIFRKKTIIFAQGIGPINNKKLEKLTAFILKRASYVTVRDNKSLALLQNWGINAIKCSDPVWNIKLPQKKENNKIGIQLRECKNIDNNFVQELAKNVCKYYSNKEIQVLSLQNKQDLDICNQFKENLLKINQNINVEVIENTSNDKIIEDINNLDTLIAMRFHACLVAIKSNVKLLPISYDIKVKELANEFDLQTINLDSTDTIESTFEHFNKTQITYSASTIDSHMFNFKALESII